LLLGKGMLGVQGHPARSSLLITPAALALGNSGVLERPVDF
jgi:hypothetical protein